VSARYTVMPGVKFSASAKPGPTNHDRTCSGIYLGPYDTVAELLAAVHAAQLVDHVGSWGPWRMAVEERES